jgi:hypothetical protein
VIIIPHHPLSPNFFIENPTKKISDFLWDYLYALPITLVLSILSTLRWGSMFIFGGSKNGKSSQIKLTKSLFVHNIDNIFTGVTIHEHDIVSSKKKSSTKE